MKKNTAARAKFGAATLELARGDITREAVDAIVNAANEKLAGGGGVDGAIHRAGGPAIMEECRRIGGCPTGKVVITTAGQLAAKHVLHAVGPIWRGGANGEAELLASCYREALTLAEQKGLVSVAFPSISTGIYGYPVDQAAATALSTVAAFLAKAKVVQLARFVLFDDRTFDAYAAALSGLGVEAARP
ncbi:MAG: O-acetyl-ADP-ribose deacetylase [Planctomycetes bacterium]|nr:O-acetyl-ADP-ribose deacetylase [Planctomycetota bacterium]